MIDLSSSLSLADALENADKFWEASGRKILAIERDFDPELGAPVFTVDGKYSVRGWTEWTKGFQIGSSVLQFDASGDQRFLEIARSRTVDHMAHHVTNVGVHDHGFNNVSTYGGLLRLMNEGRTTENEWERNFYELALKASGAVQASRWTRLSDNEGYIHSFNGAHSLFSDTIRSLRALGAAHQLGHVLKGENDHPISLLGRLVQHARATSDYNVYYGEGRDGYDVRGRVVHESIFNTKNGAYRCPSSQQGYSPFTTWTRGLAWVVCGYPEQLEFLDQLSDEELVPFGGRGEIRQMLLGAATAACDYYIASTPTCGVPYWDTGAPGLHKIEEYAERPADPFNDYEPVDSSAAAIAAQGLLRLGRYLNDDRYWQAGLRVVKTLLSQPYLSHDDDHHGLILHSVYHWPNRWDHVPGGSKVAYGEATMWGDYHAREVMLYLKRIQNEGPYLKFFLDN
jgi:unsaturated chondroitin disaccharide hydrolase